jgi:outer membrane scaffolding protein for murein synthesis (MipA/OmpV family)
MFATLACVAVFQVPSACNAESLPLWEAGAGVGAISLPDYRGSEVTKTYLVPTPYFVYRGDILKADRNGVRSTLFGNDKVEVNLSLNATLPVHSKDDPARRGMADLRPTIEFGPTVNVNLWQSTGQKMKVDFRAPLRSSITIESSPKAIGWLLSPSLNLDVRDPAGFSGWRLGLLGGLIFNDRRYNAHFYSVGPSDVTATRPLYSASGGYSGSQFTTALSKRFPRYWVGGFVRYDALGGAVFENSPLVTKRNTVSAGVVISWVFGESSRRVDVVE